MSEIKAIEKLRESSHLDDNKWTLENGDVVTMFGADPTDQNAVNWGDQWRKLADEIEAEIAEKYMKLPVDIDGVLIHIGDYLQLGKTHGRVIALTYRQYNELPWEWQCDSNSDWYNTKFTRHAEPRTVEDVLMDVMSDFADADFNNETLETITARYADEIRDMLGGDAE